VGYYFLTCSASESLLILNVNEKYQIVPLEDDNEILLYLDSDTIAVPSHMKMKLCLLPKINTSHNHVSCHYITFFPSFCYNNIEMLDDNHNCSLQLLFIPKRS